MSVTIRDVFDKHLARVKYDSKLAQAMYKYQIGYINRNHEHLEFFGSNLLGVHVVRFKDSDVTKFFDEVLDVDYYALVEDVKTIDTFDVSFKVAGDTLNLTCMYLIHKFLTSSILGESQRHRAAYDVALIFFYRCIAALQSHHFRYPTDPKVAQAAYAKLSNKFLIKKLGSWHKVMDYRATDLTNKHGIHYKNFITFNNDQATVYAISDSQGRIKDLVKNYCKEFFLLNEAGESIAVTSSSHLNAEGEEVIREKTMSVEHYVNYMRNAITDKHTFIKDDLVQIIAKTNTNTSFRMVKHTLSWMYESYSNPKFHNEIDDFIGSVVIYSMYLIQNNIETTHNRDYPHILSSLKNLYLSTRSNDPDLTKIRDLGEKIIKYANGKISTSLALSTRTSIVLYITLRALAEKSKV